MSSQRGNEQSYRNFLSIGLILMCLTGAILAQTFHYSPGWINGKKRSSIIPYVFQDPTEGEDILGICQMKRLRETLQGRHRDQAYLPCEVLGKPEDEVIERFRRKIDYKSNPILDSIPTQEN